MRALDLAVPALAVALVGCGPAASLSLRGGYCAPPGVSAASFAEDPAPPAGASRAERLAALVGLRAALGARKAAEAPSIESRVQVLERMEVVRLALAATAAELDCEGERAQQAADYLAHGASKATQSLTVASIGVATVTAIAGVILSTRNAPAGAQDGVAIGGGALTAGLGLSSLYVHPRVDFAHPRNLLADVWTGPASSASYPPFLWAYLTRREFSNEQVEPIRAKIVARWRLFEQLRDGSSGAALLFGAGGAYDADALSTRAAMLDEVKAEVSLANQDLEALASELLPRAR